VINTHYHADHSYGTCLFPEATVVAQARCYELLDTRGREGLAQAKANMPELESTEIALPHLVFNQGVLNLYVGNKTLQLWHLPGHSPDALVCLIKEDRVLFAGDTLMSIPYFVDGDYNTLVESLVSLQHNTFENIIQGHGEIILRGEVEEKIQSDLDYLAALKRHVEIARARPDPTKYLTHVDIEHCGKSRILLNGNAQQLHRANLQRLYHTLQPSDQVVGASG
jgi:glyoxylase-like metal-dependent hydrolase (beta-lactamase superfamily II)